MVVNGLGKTGPEFLSVGLTGVFFVRSLKFGAENFVTLFATGEADDFELRGEVTSCGDVIKGGDKFPVGEVTRGSEDDDGAGFRTILLDECFLEGVFHERFSFFGF